MHVYIHNKTATCINYKTPIIPLRRNVISTSTVITILLSQKPLYISPLITSGRRLEIT